jgi:hypothetical protein
VKVDIEAFEDEYLKQMPVLKFNLAWQGEGEDKKIVCPDYNNATWESVTDLKERQGSVAKARADVEEWLKTAPPDSFALIVSPEGWSGLTDVDGNNIRYTSTQAYAFHTLADGSLEAYTFRYQANILQNEELQRSFGLITTEDPNQKRRIKNTVTNVALISGEDSARPVRSFSEIVDKIQSAVGGREIAYDGKTFAEIKALLNNQDGFNKKSLVSASLITRFQEYAKKRISMSDIVDQEKDLQIALGITIAQLHNSYSEVVMPQNDKDIFVSESARNQRDEAIIAAFMSRAASVNYAQAREKLSLLSGCAGGGQKTYATSMGMPRQGEINPLNSGKTESNEDSEDYEFDHEGKCVKCDADPRALGPCDICEKCDAELGGKASKKTS